MMLLLLFMHTYVHTYIYIRMYLYIVAKTKEFVENKVLNIVNLEL